MDFKNIAGKLSPKGWLAIGGGAAAFIAFIMIVMSFAATPSYTTLMAGMDPAQTGKITAALDSKGITYQIQNNGTALAVSPAQVGAARIALATGGLLTGQSQPGMSLMDNQQLGASNFQQQITYQRALEGQLASTIQSIQGVTSAQVNLALPNAQQQLFSDSSNAQAATGAVLLSASGTLDPNSVRGIAQLVAASVPGLKTDKVTITDGTGALLWPTSSSASGGDTGLLAKQDAENRYNAMMSAQANAVLTQALGPGKAQVTISSDLNANQASSDILTYGKKGVPLSSQATGETLVGNGTSGSGGTAGSVPGYAAANAAGAAGGGRSNYKNVSSNVTFGVSKTVTHMVVAPGAVNKQAVSVLIDSSVPASEIPSLRAAVANAVGIQASRGDKISIGQVAFPKLKVTPATAPAATAKIMGYAKYLIIGMLSILFLAFISRSLRKREREPFAGNPTWLRELESPRSLAAVELETAEAQTRVQQLQTRVSPARMQVEDLVDREPGRVAAQVRAWMVED